MKRLLLTLAYVITACIYVYSQPDTGSTVITRQITALKPTYHPVFKLTAKEIEQLPFTNLMEVLNGLFPFVFADPPVTDAYNFMIDGRLLVNPNAINISQIALIEYYPVAFNLANGTFSQKGTFVITTKTATDPGYGLNARLQGGVFMPANSTFAVHRRPINKSNGENDLFTLQEISYGYHQEALSLSGGISFTQSAITPAYKYSPPQGTEEYDNGFQRLRFSGLLGYQLSSKIKLTAALFGLSQANKHEYSFRPTNTISYSETKMANEPIYLSGHAGMEFNITNNIRNLFQVEYSDIKTDSTINGFNQLSTPGSMLHFDSELRLKDRQFAVTNSLKAHLNTGKAVEFGAELLLRYYESRNTTNYAEFLRDANGTVIGTGMGYSKFNARSIAVMPRLSVLLYNQFLVSAGLTYDSWNNSLYTTSSEDKSFPYAGLRWRMTRAKAILSSLDIHSSYSKTWNMPQVDRLDVHSRPGAVGFLFSDVKKAPGATWISGIDAGFANDKLLLTVNYYKGNIYYLFTTPVFPGGSTSFYREVNTQGLSAGLQAVIANKKQFALKLKALMFYEKYELEDKTNEEVIRFNHPFLNDNVSPQWRGSLQANADIGRFFLQAIALMRFNDIRFYFVPGQGRQQEEINNHGLAYLLAGYRIPFGNAMLLRELAISLQARNLGTMGYPANTQYYGSRYAGLSVIAKL